MGRARVGEIDLEYELTGPVSGPPVLLIGGLGSQLISWDDEMCDLLAGRGYRVVRYDNRDSGLSTVLEPGAGTDLLGVLLGSSRPPYLLHDLAADAIGLLDALGIAHAHLVGISMGGMVAQLAALDHPDRVDTVTALLAGPPGRPEQLPDGPLVDVLLAPAGSSLAERVDAAVELRRALANGGTGFDAAEAARRARLQMIRADHPGATLRQVAAVLGTPSPNGGLRQLRPPILFVHGELDPLIPIEGVRRAASEIPGARLMVLPGVGHDLPAAVAMVVIDAVTRFWESAAVAS